VLVLRTLGAPQRRLLGGRRGRPVEGAEPEPVPTSRATVVRAEPFESATAAGEWLAPLRGEAADEEIALGVATVNRALHAHRLAFADAFVAEVSRERALVARIGYGAGDEVAEGRFAEAWELPPGGPRRRARRSMEAPEERFAAILGGREPALVCEALVLRARADLDAGRLREAALEARVALEALLAELGGDGPTAAAAGELAGERAAVGDAANAALRGDLTGDQAAALADAVGRMEAVLRRRRLGG
jgi:hypothetical protein